MDIIIRDLEIYTMKVLISEFVRHDKSWGIITANSMMGVSDFTICDVDKIVHKYEDDLNHYYITIDELTIVITENDFRIIELS